MPSDTRSVEVHDTDHWLLRVLKRDDEDMADVIHKLLDPSQNILEERLAEGQDLLDAYRSGDPPTRMSALDDAQAELPDEE